MAFRNTSQEKTKMENEIGNQKTQTNTKTENPEWGVVAEKSRVLDVVEDGSYTAVLITLEKMALQYGDALKLVFEITSGPEATKTVSGLANFKLTPNTKLYGWIEALAGKGVITEGKTYNVSSLIGLKGKITVVNEEKDFNGEKTSISNVVSIKPLK